MPEATTDKKKAKRAEDSSTDLPSVKRARTATTPTPTPELILDLEKQISNSTEHYNNLVYLLQYMKNEDPQISLLSATALFRSFAKMMLAGLFSPLKKSMAGTPQETLSIWLKEKYKEYKSQLIELLTQEDAETAFTSLTILIRLVKEESTHLSPRKDEYYFAKTLLKRVVSALLNLSTDDLLLEFVDKYVDVYYDIRYHFLNFASILATEQIEEQASSEHEAQFTMNLISALAAITSFPEDASEIIEFLVAVPVKEKTPVKKLSSQRGALQDSWLAVLKGKLNTGQYKYILQIMHKKIVPNINKPQLLMDFLTDSYDAGGVVSLLSLNALFLLMQKYNLDYPNFYTKLYALLDRNILHVKHRSRFFRLLDLFLSSTHLPAALVASFIKRLSRLAISAPPSAIVIVVPFVYNLLKRHTTCNLLLQRTDFTNADSSKFGLNDPFNDEESDPNKTGAMESSVWELATLQDHYHPNVGTLAKILSEPFYKPSYNIEDFMDHSYTTMLDAEFVKNIRKPPAVEFEIAASVFTSNEKNQQAYLSGWEL
ncbi:CBF/Mak21 family-domain-containing protein [Kockiozyma suomiensis]|uniref:CBF/Mak21 family-domain-containing protein n=1 Tax=Kockiozyma suomiensis TaxID=1337062 RepID=UPI003343F5C7